MTAPPALWSVAPIDARPEEGSCAVVGEATLDVPEVEKREGWRWDQSWWYMGLQWRSKIQKE